MIFVVAVVDAAVAVGVVAVVVDTVVAVDDAIVVDAAAVAVDVNDDDESCAFVSMQFERSFGWAYFEKLQAHA